MFVGLAVGLALEKMELRGLCQLKSSKFALSRDFGKSYFKILPSLHFLTFLFQNAYLTFIVSSQKSQQNYDFSIVFKLNNTISDFS